MADGSKKERLTIDEILDLMPEATTEDLKSFAGFIYLFGRGW
jgi:Mg/Co/Ni transporter MgtE